MVDTTQLLAKALSTTSEQEAIACLLMARKHGITTLPEKNISKDWHAETIKYYNEYLKIHSNYNNLWNRYTYCKFKLKFSYIIIFILTGISIVAAYL